MAVRKSGIVRRSHYSALSKVYRPSSLEGGIRESAFRGREFRLRWGCRASAADFIGKRAMPSFDIVSRTEIPEVDNALQGAMREISTRYDFKGSACSIERKDEVLTILADDKLKLRQVQELLKGYLVKRKVAPGAFDFQEPEKASGDSVRQTVVIKQGLDRELARKIVKSVKAAKMKVQVAIQGDELRISGKKRDDLQAAMALVKDMKLDQPLQYVNFRD